MLAEDIDDNTIPESLGGLVRKYNIHPPGRQTKAGPPVFEGQDCAGNDAAAILETSLCIVTHSLFGTTNYEDDHDDGIYVYRKESYLKQVILISI